MKNLKKIIDSHVERGLYPGVEWKINYKENIFKDKSGCINIKNKKPIVEDTIYRIWSMTKPIVSLVALHHHLSFVTISQFVVCVVVM